MDPTFRLLPEDEWPRLVTDGIEPFATHGLPDAAQRSMWRFLIAEHDGRIVGCSSLHDAVMNHWWISSRARRSPTMVSGLWQATKAVLDQYGVTMLHATVLDSQPEVQAMVERLGYVPADGKLFLLFVPNCVLNERSA